VIKNIQCFHLTYPRIHPLTVHFDLTALKIITTIRTGNTATCQLTFNEEAYSTGNRSKPAAVTEYLYFTQVFPQY